MYSMYNNRILGHSTKPSFSAEQTFGDILYLLRCKTLSVKALCKNLILLLTCFTVFTFPAEHMSSVRKTISTLITSELCLLIHVCLTVMKL